MFKIALTRKLSSAIFAVVSAIYFSIPSKINLGLNIVIKTGKSTSEAIILIIKVRPNVRPKRACKRISEKSQTKIPIDTIIPLKNTALPEVISVARIASL